MKGFKTRVMRPGSARPKAPLIPGITEAPHADIAHLFIESKQKEIEFEKSRSKLLLHIESKKSQEEKDILSKKYDETIQNMNDTHQSRMKALTKQHEIANEALMEQFKNEITALKASHKAHIDRLLSESQEKSSDYLSKVEDLNRKNAKRIEKINADHRLAQTRLQESLEKQFQAALDVQKEKFEREKYDFCENAIKERDSQIKTIINKLYEECRKEWRSQEVKLNEEIRSLKHQLESTKLKLSTQKMYESVQIEDCNPFSQNSVSSSQQKEPNVLLESVDLFKRAKKPEFSISEEVLPLRQVLSAISSDKTTQTHIESFEKSTETEPDYSILQEVQLLKDSHNKDLLTLESKVTETIHKKNSYIKSLESHLSQLVLRNKELEAFLKQLNC